MNFQSRFEALNDVFWEKWEKMGMSRFEAIIIQVDIGGHPPIPFEPLTSILLVFQFQHNLLFLAVFRSWTTEAILRL